MRLLLDTHVVLWWLAAPGKLSPRVREALERPGTRVALSSVVSAEISIKHAIGRLSLPDRPAAIVTSLLEEDGFEPLALEHAHALELGRLPLHHRDPFDRMLVGQARVEHDRLVTADEAIRQYDVDVFW